MLSRLLLTAINGWKLQRAIKFLENVQEHKEAVPMRRYAGGTGRAAQGMSLAQGDGYKRRDSVDEISLQESNSEFLVHDGQSSLLSSSSVS